MDYQEAVRSSVFETEPFKEFLKDLKTADLGDMQVKERADSESAVEMGR